MTWRTRSALVILGLGFCAAAPAAAQQGAGEGRRAQLEDMVLDRFLDRTAAQIGMRPEQRTRIEAILRASAARNREQRQAGMRLRRELIAAVADSSTPDAEFDRVLGSIERLRAEEQEAWQHDQRAIAGVLTPRQRAAFAVRWLELQETVREMIGRRGERRGMARPPPR